MFKDRVKKWGVEKKSKEKEMRAIVHKRQQRADSGKPSLFTIRGKAIEWRAVILYWKRKNMAIADVIAQRQLSKTPDAVKCLTPLASPITTPSAFAISERMFCLIRNYHQGSFESGIRLLPQCPRSSCYTLKNHRFTLDFEDSLSFHKISVIGRHESPDFREVKMALPSVLEGIQQALLAEGPFSMSMFLRLIGNVLDFIGDEVALNLSREAADFSQAFLGENHPLRLICQWFASMERPQLDVNLIKAQQCITDSFSSILGPLHQITLLAHLYCIDRIKRDCNRDQKCLSLQSLLHEVEVALEANDVRIILVRLGLGYTLLENHNSTEALRIGQVVIDHALNVQPHSNAAFTRAQGLQFLARCWYHLHDNNLAEAYLREAIDVLHSAYGMANALAEDLSTRLWVWQFIWARQESATHLISKLTNEE